MKVLIDKQYSGLKNSYIYDTVKKLVITKAFDQALNITSDYFLSLNKILVMNGKSVFVTLENRYKSMLSILCLEEEDIDWQSILGDDKIKNINKNFIEVIDSAFLNMSIDYIDILHTRYTFTNRFKSAIFKNQELHRPKYCHVSSKTGRVKIVEGQNYLVMKRDDRVNLSSSYVNGKIYEIDIVSLEPRVMLHYLEIEQTADIYDYIKDKLGLVSERSAIKLGVLACMYGAADKTIKSMSGMNKTDIKKLKEYFQIKDLISRLESEYKDNGHIKNAYGRPIYDNHSILNYFVQSSSADCACLAFDELLESFKGCLIRPIAFIHDSIIIDCHPNHFDMIDNIKNIYEYRININLPVKVKVIS